MKPPIIIERHIGTLLLWFERLRHKTISASRIVFGTDTSLDTIVVALGVVSIGFIGYIIVSSVTVAGEVDTVNRAYQEVLHRKADESGMKNYRDSGMTFEDIKKSLEKSKEKKVLLEKEVNKEKKSVR